MRVADHFIRKVLGAELPSSRAYDWAYAQPLASHKAQPYLLLHQFEPAHNIKINNHTEYNIFLIMRIKLEKDLARNRAETKAIRVSELPFAKAASAIALN